MTLANLTPQQLRQAADLQEQIQSLQKELSSILEGVESPAPAAGQKKRTLSPAGRAAIAAAARARWAKARSETATSGVKKPRRKISKAGREALAAAARERWRKAKASGRSRL